MEVPGERLLATVLTPDASFNMFFNHANPIQEPGRRKPGGSLMCYAGGAPATRLLELSDQEITQYNLPPSFIIDLSNRECPPRLDRNK